MGIITILVICAFIYVIVKWNKTYDGYTGCSADTINQTYAAARQTYNDEMFEARQEFERKQYEARKKFYNSINEEKGRQ